MKRTAILFLILLLSGCAQKPSCDDDDVLRIVIQIIKDDFLVNDTPLSFYDKDGKMITITRDIIDNHMKINLTDFITNKSKDEKISRCMATAKLETELFDTKEQNIEYSARYTDDGDKICVEVYN